MNLQSLSLGWFDFLVIVVVIAGIILGRKNGFSTELIPTTKWLTIILLGGSLYAVLGNPFATSAQIQPNLAFVLAYLGLAALIAGAFHLLKMGAGQKLIGTDIFGRFESPLGLAATVVRFLCVLFFFLALLNARYTTDEEVANWNTMQKEEFGSITFPTVMSVQQDVFARSQTGRRCKYYLGNYLIKAQPPVKYEVKKIEGYGKKMERAAEEALEDPKK